MMTFVRNAAGLSHKGDVFAIQSPCVVVVYYNIRNQHEEWGLSGAPGIT